jgi:hypothetical protein
VPVEGRELAQRFRGKALPGGHGSEVSRDRSGDFFFVLAVRLVLGVARTPTRAANARSKIRKPLIFNVYKCGNVPAIQGARTNMKIKWLLPMTVCIMALHGADSGNHTTAGKPPVVRMVEFKNFHGVSVKEIVNRLNDRDIQLVERPYSAQYVETAQGIVEELMAEKGQRGIHVTPTVTSVQTNAVRVTFTAAP